MRRITHLGQYWSSEQREVRLLGCADFDPGPSCAVAGEAFDLSGSLGLPAHRRRFRAAWSGRSWEEVAWTYTYLPFPLVELAELVEASGRTLPDGAGGHLEDAAGRGRRLDLAALDCEPLADRDHLVAPVIPRRAQAFGVTYLNSALERESEGKRADYSFVYRAVKERGERPELFLKGTAPEHFVGPNARMGLRCDLTNSEDAARRRVERVTVSAGIEPELAAVVHSNGRIWGYTLANDVSGNRIENETVLYLYQAKHFTGSLVLGPLVWLSAEQENPRLEIRTRIRSADGALLFERLSTSAKINAPLAALIAWASSHIRLTPGEVFSTGTDVVPDGDVKVLSPGMAVEISSPAIGTLRHGAAYVPQGAGLNLDYSRLEFESGVRSGA
jgi:2-keto-4-pentenoate hydratase/2-oxohepta-3-ene-1,7-dioic acid hydratase in catechol pathway